MPDPNLGLLVLDRDAHPDVRGRRSRRTTAPKVIPHQRTALGEDLEAMPIGGFHGFEDAIDVFVRDVLVKEVALLFTKIMRDCSQPSGCGTPSGGGAGSHPSIALRSAISSRVVKDDAERTPMPGAQSVDAVAHLDLVFAVLASDRA